MRDLKALLKEKVKKTKVIIEKKPRPKSTMVKRIKVTR